MIIADAQLSPFDVEVGTGTAFNIFSGYAGQLTQDF